MRKLGGVGRFGSNVMASSNGLVRDWQWWRDPFQRTDAIGPSARP